MTNTNTTHSLPTSVTQDFRERAKMLRRDLKRELGYGPRQVAVRSNRNSMRVHPLVDGLDTGEIKRLGEKYAVFYLNMRDLNAPSREAVIYSGFGFTP